MKKILAQLTYANVMATAAVFIALGGASYAAMRLPKNSVGTKQLKNGAVSGSKIKNGAITGAKIDLGSLGSVPSAAIANHAASADSASHAGDAVVANRANNAATAGDADTLDSLPSSAFASASQILQGSAKYAAAQTVIAFPGGMEILTKAGNSSVVNFKYPGGDRWTVYAENTSSSKNFSSTEAFPITGVLEPYLVRNVSAGLEWMVSCSTDLNEADITCVAAGG